MKRDRALRDAALVIVVGMLATTLSQPQALGKIPLQNLLKNDLHVDRTANAAFFFWMGLAWYFKPFAGILTDAFPLMGTRRRSYILLGSALATASWAWLYFTPRQYNPMLWVAIALNTFMVIASTVVGGYMVEVAQANSGSGRLTALRQFAYQASILISGPAGGWLAASAFGWTPAWCGGVMFLLIPTTIFWLHERRVEIPSQELLANAGRQLVNIGSARTMWAAAGLMALFYIAPGLPTALFYKQQNDLHMSTQAQGFLYFLSGGFGMLAAVIYGFLCRRFNLRTLLLWCLGLGTLGNLVYLIYASAGQARFAESFNGFGYSMAELALMDLAVRATPPGSEGLGYSLMMSVRNLALFGTDWFGSNLLDHYHVHFNTLVWANAATTVVTIPLSLLLPLVLVRRRDAQTE